MQYSRKLLFRYIQGNYCSNYSRHDVYLRRIFFSNTFIYLTSKNGREKEKNYINSIDNSPKHGTHTCRNKFFIFLPYTLNINRNLGHVTRPTNVSRIKKDLKKKKKSKQQGKKGREGEKRKMSRARLTRVNGRQIVIVNRNREK